MAYNYYLFGVFHRKSGYQINKKSGFVCKIIGHNYKYLSPDFAKDTVNETESVIIYLSRFFLQTMPL